MNNDNTHLLWMKAHKNFNQYEGILLENGVGS